MLKSTLTRGVLASAVLMSAAVGIAQADDGAKKWDAVNKAKVTLVQAIQTAEQHQPGKAVKADLEVKRNSSYYEVDVVSAEKRAYEVRVDAETGKVISSKEDND